MSEDTLLVKLSVEHIEGTETMDIIRAIEQQQIKEVTPFNVGDTVKVWVEKVDRDRKKISLTMVQGK